VVNPKLPVENPERADRLLQRQSGKLNLANAGAGTQSHLAGVLLARAAKLDVIHVPYKGGGASVGAVIAGESPVTITPAPAVMAISARAACARSRAAARNACR